MGRGRCISRRADADRFWAGQAALGGAPQEASRKASHSWAIQVLGQGGGRVCPGRTGGAGRDGDEVAADGDGAGLRQTGPARVLTALSWGRECPACVFGLVVLAADDEPRGEPLAPLLRGERGVGHLGDFGVGDSAAGLPVPDRLRIPDTVQASSPMAAIADRMLAFIGTMAEKCAPWVWRALITAELSCRTRRPSAAKAGRAAGRARVPAAEADRPQDRG